MSITSLLGLSHEATEIASGQLPIKIVIKKHAGKFAHKIYSYGTLIQNFTIGLGSFFFILNQARCLIVGGIYPQETDWVLPLGAILTAVACIWFFFDNGKISYRANIANLLLYPTMYAFLAIVLFSKVVSEINRVNTINGVM